MPIRAEFDDSLRQVGSFEVTLLARLIAGEEGSIAKFEQGSTAAVRNGLQGEIGYAGMPNRSVMKSA